MNKKTKLVLGVLSALMLLLGAGIWYAIATIDTRQLSGLLISSVKASTGRDLKITGPVSLTLFPRIAVTADQLSLSNAPWSSEPNMLSLKHIELNISLWPLLSKRVEISSVRLDGLSLYLQKNAAGLANWELSLPPAMSDTSLQDRAGTMPADNTSDAAEMVSLKNMSITDSTIYYQAGSSPQEQYLVKNFSIAESGSKSDISLAMKYKGQDLNVSGKSGLISELIKRWDQAPVVFDVDFNLGLNGKTVLLKGGVNKDPHTLPSVDLTIHSKSLNWPLLNSPSSGQPPAVASSRTAYSQSRYLLSDESLNFRSLPHINGTIGVNIGALNFAAGKPLENLRATVQFKGDAIDLSQLSFQLGQGTASMQGQLSGFDNATPAMKMMGITQNMTLENLLAISDPSSKVSGGNLKLAFDLQGSGQSLHQFAANANGKIQVSIDQATVGSNFLNDAGDFVVTIMNSLNPLRKKTNETMLKCAVAYLPIRSGQISIANSVGVETDRLHASMSGSINLKTEAVDLSIHPRENSGLTTGLDLAGLVKVGGTLSNPKAAINQAGVVNSAVSIGLGFLTGGASILAENAKSLSSKTNPCQDALHPWADIYPGAK